MSKRIAEEIVLSFIEYELLAIGIPSTRIKQTYRKIKERGKDKDGKEQGLLRGAIIELETPEGVIETNTSQIRMHLAKRLRQNWEEGLSLPQTPSYPQIAKTLGLKSHATAMDLETRTAKIRRYEGLYESTGTLSQMGEDEDDIVERVQDNTEPNPVSPLINDPDKKEPYTNGFLHENETDEARANLNLERIVKEGLRVKGASDEEVSRIYDQLQKIQEGPDKEDNVTFVSGIPRPLSRLRASLAHWMYTVAEKGTLGELEVSYALNYTNLLESMNAIEEENQRINTEIRNRVQYGTSISE
jgi:hypothetical protein